MPDKTNNKNTTEKPVEVSLKTPSGFYSPSNLQPQESCQDRSMQDVDGNLLTTYFSDIVEKLLQNKQILWVILRRFWQEANLKI